MNDEIKEILDRLKYTNNDVMWCDKITLDVEQSHLLLDYITNLQQELEIMVKDDQRTQQTIIRLTKENERLKEDYAIIVNDNCDYLKLEQENERKERLITQYGEGMCAYANRIYKAVEYINKNKKVVSKYEAKDTRLPLDTFMWGVDKLLNILQGENNGN